jgi:hypothetical protein
MKEEKGSALLVALLLMIMLTLIFIAAVTTSMNDINIAQNQKEKTSALYVAEGGLELGMRVLRDNVNILDNDSLEAKINSSSLLGNGSFNVEVTGSVPYKTLTSYGKSYDGQGTVQVTVRRRVNPLSVWDNIIFAGTGLTGKAIAGNVSLHGSVTILGEGEPFTDQNGNGQWDDQDRYADLNSNGKWDPGEPLTVDHDNDAVWDPAEPYGDGNGNGQYERTLTAADLSYEVTGTAHIYNNYQGMNTTLSSRVPALDTTTFNGEVVNTLNAELRVKHGRVDISGSATIGFPDQSGGSPPVKETVDGCYVNDGYGGNKGESNAYSDNGTSEGYDLSNEMQFPSLTRPYTDPATGTGYDTYLDYLHSNSLVVTGDLTLQPGVSMARVSNSYGSISMDANGDLSISGIVYVTGNIHINSGSGKLNKAPVTYDGRGTLVSQGSSHIDTHLLSKGMFPTDDVLGIISANDLGIGTGSGDSHLDIMGVFYAQKRITNAKQNQLAGAMVSNYFSISNVPDLFQVPVLVENLPLGMPGSGTIVTYTYQTVPGTWREL